jgi:hypothetical protein
VFPPIDGDLLEEMRGYDRSRLQKPDELNTVRARAWAGARLRSLRERLPRGGHEEEERQPPTDAAAQGPPSAEATAAGDEAADEGGHRVVARLEEEIGHQAFDAMVRRLPALLDELSGRPPKPVAQHDPIPAAPGVYLFSDGPTPLYVGNTSDLRERLRQQVDAAAPPDQSSLAWRLALRDARERGLATPETPEELKADPNGAECLRRACQRVAGMDVRFIEIDDPITRTVFEIYAAQALGTADFNSFQAN